MNKKAQISIPISWIILISGFVILGAFIITNLYPSITKEAGHSSCALSVENAAVIANTRPAGFQLQGIKSFKELKGCKTEDYTGKNSISETDPEKIHLMLSESLYNCWNDFGQGKLDFLKDFTIGNYCHICSKFKFDNDAEVSELSLLTYMYKTEPYKTNFRELSLTDFDGQKNKAISQSTIKKDQKLYTVLIATKVAQETPQDLIDFVAYLETKYLIGAFFETDTTKIFKPTYKVALVSGDTITKHCRVV